MVTVVFQFFSVLARVVVSVGCNDALVKGEGELSFCMVLSI